MQRKKEVPQEPEYKALDMKPAYEKPKPPLPAPAPEPAKPAEEQRALKEEPTLERKSADQNARGFMLYDAPEKESSDQESASQPPAAAMAKKKAATASAEMSEKQILTLVVSDVDQAAARVEDTVKEYGGKIIRKETADGVLSLTVAMDPASRNRFIDRLKTVGELKDKDARETYREETVIAIRIVKQIQQK